MNPAGPAAQVRTWNLSSLWRIPLEDGGAWLKVVPPFFAHEGAVLELLAAEAVPPLIARDGARILMPELPGEDLYEAADDQRPLMVTMLTDLQHRWSGRIKRLLDTGMADWRAAALGEAIPALIRRLGGTVSAEARSGLGRLEAGLPRRFADLEACGLPDTLVHGDFHPGNLRGGASRMTILDWGDCGVGHPLLDQPAFLGRARAGTEALLRTTWSDAWRRLVPGCDPDRAAELIAPIAAVRQALIYQHFLDNIEPAEHPYHRADPADWLTRAASLLDAEAGDQT
jgi:Ser/Thr protein kinase RdoA (MazF antagonist)